MSIAIQFASQVLPPSSENACSKRHELAVISDMTNRTKMVLPFNVSWSKNSPRPGPELPDRGLAQGATPAVGKIQAPLVRLGVVQTEVQTFEVTCRAVGHELHQIGAAIPNFSDYGDALIFDPGSRAG